jgi:fumarate reductase subunit C
MSARKPYMRQMSKTSWFMAHSRYKSYILREVSSLFVGLYMALLIFGLFRLGSGPDAWAGFLAFVKSPLVLLLSLIAFAMFIVHTVSWFQAVPQVLRIQQGGARQADRRRPLRRTRRVFAVGPDSGGIGVR